MAVIKDVAKYAGVSISTVSKYFNNPSGLTEPYRTRVEEAVRALDFSPNPLARGLRTKLTNSLALVVPDIDNYFYSEIYSSIRSAAMEQGYVTQLYTTQENRHELIDLLSRLSPVKTDGILICFLDEDEMIDRISHAGLNIPITLMSWDVNNQFQSVVLSMSATIYRATKALLDAGHRRIAYIGGTPGSRISEEKYSGYARAMREQDIPIRDDYLFSGNYRFHIGYQATGTFMSLAEPPTGIVCANDTLAVGCLKYLGAHDYTIPGDVAVVGMDGTQLSRIYDPSITTMAMPIGDMCRTAVDLLIQKITKPNMKNSQVIFESHLVIGRSTHADAPLYLDY